MQSPLEGVRVLDFTHALAGPYCSLLLAQYGATIYKLEGPGQGDIGRGWGPPFSGEQASFFLGLNAGKLGVSIDIKKPEGLELCLGLIERADVLIENFRPGILERLGLGYGAARERNGRLIYCSISGYGQSGPWRDEPAMDLIVQAASGLISLTGTAEGEQVRCGHSVADTTAGLFALAGILMALRVREQTGAGQFVDVSMFDSLISTMCSSFAYYAGSGKVAGPMGTSFATIVPYRTFPAKDREIALAIGSEKLWAAFCRAIGRPELACHADYATNALRVKNRGVLEPLLIDIFRQATAEEWMQRLSAEGIPASPVRNVQDVFESVQAEARAMFLKVDAFAVTGPPLKFSDARGNVGAAAPRVGEHTRAVLGDLFGLNQSELDRLAASGVIAAPEASRLI